MLKAIESKLYEVADRVYYGAADDADNISLWNYIVFLRDTIRRSETSTGYSDYYTVAIIHENWVPQEMIDAVIDKLETLKGVRLAKTDIEFDYTRKPGTNAVIEVASIPFVHARKKV